MMNGSMTPTPGISQQEGALSVDMDTDPAMNLSLSQRTSNAQQSKYARIWEGSLYGIRHGQPVFICNLEGYMNHSASYSLVSDWPSTMQIVRLIAQECMNNEQYVGKPDFLVFRTLNQHGFLGQLQEKKLCAVIQLPSQTLLLSVSDKAGRLIGMLLPGINQAGMSMNQQNIMNGLISNNMSSGLGSMVPTPGISQQAGALSVDMDTNPAMNLPVSHHTSNVQQSKYVRIWEGSLYGIRHGQPVFICNLEGYRNQSASDSLAYDWPSAMRILRLIDEEHVNNKQYVVGKSDFLVFRTLNQHGFLEQLQERKLCAVIQLPSQTLLLSVSDKAGRLIGMLFPGDIVVYKPQVPNQQQQHPQQIQPQPQQLQPQQLQQLQSQELQLQQLLQQLYIQPQSHSHMQQHQLQMQQQLQQQSQHQHMQQPQSQQQQEQQQQQQMTGTGMGPTFIQGHPRSQLMAQGQVQQPGPGNMSGGGFMP